MRMTARGYKVSSRDSENVLELDRDDDCNSHHCTKCRRLNACNMLIVYHKFYLKS